MSATSAFGLIIVMLVVGRVLMWRRVVPDSAPAALNLVVLYVCLPAAVLLYAPKLTFQRELLGLVAVPWSILAASLALTFAVSKLLRFQRDATAVLLLLVALGNTSFLGFALMPTLAGDGALRYAVAYDQFGTFVILCTFGLVTLGLYGGERPTLASIVKRIVTFVPFIALVIALTVMPRDYPDAIAKPLKLTADSLLPLVALASGMQLQLKMPRHHLVPLGYGLAAKLLLMPLLALGLATLFGLHGQMRDATVYETAMPPMITAGALLSLAGLAPELAAAMVGFGMVAAMATLPLWHWLLAG